MGVTPKVTPKRRKSGKVSAASAALTLHRQALILKKAVGNIEGVIGPNGELFRGGRGITVASTLMKLHESIFWLEATKRALEEDDALNQVFKQEKADVSGQG